MAQRYLCLECRRTQVGAPDMLCIDCYRNRRHDDEDAVTRPAHYGGEANPHEPIKVIEHYGLGFCLGNAVKYILRAPFKGATLDDLKKARWYIDREIYRMGGK